MGGLTGGCQCGAVRFRIAALQPGGNICHCRMCQKASGGPFMAFANVRRADFAVTHGTLAAFRSSDIAERGFCRDCGTPLTWAGLGRETLSVTIGSLDDPEAAAPDEQLAREAAPSWLEASLQTPNTPLSDWLAAKKVQSVGDRQHPDHD